MALWSGLDDNEDGDIETVDIYFASDSPVSGQIKMMVENMVSRLQNESHTGDAEGGRAVGRFSADENTEITVVYDATGPTPMARATVQQRGAEENQRIQTLLAGMVQCPFPYGIPGKRMFSQILGVDEPGGSAQVSEATDLSWPYLPSIFEGVLYCTQGEDPVGGYLRLRNEFLYNGAVYENMYTQDSWIAFEGGNHFNINDNGHVARLAPCDQQDITEGGDVIGTNIHLNAIITMLGSPLGSTLCNGNNIVPTLYEGFYTSPSVQDETIVISRDMGGLQKDASKARGQSLTSSATALDRGDKPMPTLLDARNLGAGLRRDFAIINWTERNDETGEVLSEREIVLLYKNAGCDAAIGFFYGGPDGKHATGFKPFAGVDPFESHIEKDKDVWLSPQYCSNWGRSAFHLPGLVSGFLMGANLAGLAWIQGNTTSGNYNVGAESNLNSRTFWFLLDGDGSPKVSAGASGGLEAAGLAQPALLDQDKGGSQGQSVGGDIAFRA